MAHKQLPKKMTPPNLLQEEEEQVNVRRRDVIMSPKTKRKKKYQIECKDFFLGDKNKDRTKTNKIVQMMQSIQMECK